MKKNPIHLLDIYRHALHQIAEFWTETDEGEELARIAKNALKHDPEAKG